MSDRTLSQASELRRDLADIPPDIYAALNDPNVCGYLDEDGQCHGCLDNVSHQLDNGISETQVLADIERYRLEGVAARQRIAEMTR